jgi:hypothetical protein
MENIIKDSVKLYNTFVKEVTNITNKIIEQYNEMNESMQTDASKQSNESIQTDESIQIHESKQKIELMQTDESSNYDKDIVDHLYNIIYEKNNKIKELEDIIRMKN